MSKIWTGKSFYDDIKSTEIPFTLDIGGDITWPTYKNVSLYLKSMYNDLAVFSLADENKCLTYTPGAFGGTMTMQSILNFCAIVGTSSIAYRNDNFSIYANNGNDGKAIKRSGMNAPSSFFKLARVNMSNEIGGVNNGSDAPYEGYLNIYATVSVPNGTGSPNKMLIATIPIDDSEYLSLSHNPIIVLPADFNEDSTFSMVELEYYLPGRASNISTFGRESTITLKNYLDEENEFTFLDAYTDDGDLRVTFRGSQNIRLKDIIYIYDIEFDIKKDSVGSYTVNLGGWEKTTAVPNPNSTLYDGVYRSYSNYNVGSGTATMTIALTNLSSFTMYIRSYAESSYDYVMVSQLDQTITGSTSISDSTLVKAHTSGNQQSGTTLSSYTKVQYTGIPSGTHTITVVYRKDGSVNSGDDRGYVLIEKPTSGGTTPDTPTGYGYIDINFNNLYVNSFSRSHNNNTNTNGRQIYLDGEMLALNQTSSSGVDCEIFGKHADCSGYLVRVTEPTPGTIRISQNPNTNNTPYTTIFGDSLAYVKVPVVLMWSSPIIYTHIFVPVNVRINGFEDAHSYTEAGLSLFSNYCKTIHLQDYNITGVGDNIYVYNGLVSESHPYANLGVEFGHGDDACSLLGDSNNYPYMYHKYCSHCLDFYPQDDSAGSGGYSCRIYTITTSNGSNYSNWKFVINNQNNGGGCYTFNLIPDKYGSTAMNTNYLMQYWHTMTCCSYLTFRIEMMPT